MSKIFFVLILSVVTCGCASIKEAGRCVLGVSTKVVEDTRPGAIKKTFNQDYASSYDKIKECLKKTHSYIYSEDKAKHLIAVYLSETDTTPVGVFITEIDKQNTQVEISSPSTYAKEKVALRIFNTLAGLPLPEEKDNEGQIEI